MDYSLIDADSQPIVVEVITRQYYRAFSPYQIGRKQEGLAMHLCFKQKGKVLKLNVLCLDIGNLQEFSGCISGSI